MSLPTVPVASDTGLEGWTSCCGAAVTYSDTALCCKACWNEVDVVYLDELASELLSKLVTDVIEGTVAADDAVARQSEILA